MIDRKLRLGFCSVYGKLKTLVMTFLVRLFFLKSDLQILVPRILSF